MPALPKTKSFIARAIYHHRVRTSESVTLLAWRDNSDATCELWDTREADGDYVCGTEDYVFDEWVARNRRLVEDSFQRDEIRGENKWQQFIA